MKPGRAQVNGIEMFYEIDGSGAIGLSMGGNILLHLATMQPDRIEAMVVVSATIVFSGASPGDHAAGCGRKSAARRNGKSCGNATTLATNRSWLCGNGSAE